MSYLLYPSLTQNLPGLQGNNLPNLQGTKDTTGAFYTAASCWLALRKKQNQVYFRNRTTDCSYILQLYPYKAEEGGNLDSQNPILEEIQPVISCITAPHSDQE